jgi:hypothetical protein
LSAAGKYDCVGEMCGEPLVAGVGGEDRGIQAEFARGEEGF